MRQSSPVLGGWGAGAASLGFGGATAAAAGGGMTGVPRHKVVQQTTSVQANPAGEKTTPAPHAEADARTRLTYARDPAFEESFARYHSAARERVQKMLESSEIF